MYELGTETACPRPARTRLRSAVPPRPTATWTLAASAMLIMFNLLEIDRGNMWIVNLASENLPDKPRGETAW